MRSINMAYPTIDLAATGAHIRQLRLEQGYSVQDLQTYLGLEHPQAIYHWQHGRNLPSVDNLYALSKLWGVPMDKIIVEQAPYSTMKAGNGSFPTFILYHRFNVCTRPPWYAELT